LSYAGSVNKRNSRMITDPQKMSIANSTLAPCPHLVMG